jgi:hypothetical protein
MPSATCRGAVRALASPSSRRQFSTTTAGHRRRRPMDLTRLPPATEACRRGWPPQSLVRHPHPAGTVRRGGAIQSPRAIREGILPLRTVQLDSIVIRGPRNPPFVARGGHQRAAPPDHSVTPARQRYTAAAAPLLRGSCTIIAQDGCSLATVVPSESGLPGRLEPSPLGRRHPRAARLASRSSARGSCSVAAGGPASDGNMTIRQR